MVFFFFSSRRRHTRLVSDWSSDVCSSDLTLPYLTPALDSLRFIQKHRRIFFLGSWLGSFLGGQTSDSALSRVHRSEERRVGKECRYRWGPYHYRKKTASREARA